MQLRSKSRASLTSNRLDCVDKKDKPHPKPEYIISVDAETNGVYGEIWAVGAAVCAYNPVARSATVFAKILTACPFDKVRGYDPDGASKWVIENVVPAIPLDAYDCKQPIEVLQKFWAWYLLQTKYAKDNKWDLAVVVDCGYPIEANLFRLCVETDLGNGQTLAEKKDLAPYPLHEVATALLMNGKDPVDTYPRIKDENEMPTHNPLCDAIQSARLWFENGGV